MTRPFRFLGDQNSSSSSDSTTTTTTVVDSDFVVILAALLCALICVLGLVAVARCGCLRRLRISAPPPGATPPPPPVANKGVKKKVLRSLPKLTATAESAVKFSDCAICLSEFTAGEEIRVLPQCGHGFHVCCIDAWLKSHSSCPSCRQILAVVVSRCDKCGGIPPAPSTASSSTVPPTPADSDASILKLSLRVRGEEDDANRFLP